MVVVKKYAQNITQTSGQYANQKYYRTWSNLNNLQSEGGVSQCGQSNSISTYIGGKTGTWPRPSTISFKNFGFNIPDYAKITRIRVGYSHYKLKVGGAYGVFAAPTITILNAKNLSSKGYAVPTSKKNFVTSFTTSLTPKQVNDYNFGLKLNYPANSSTNISIIRLSDVWVEVTYSAVKFSVNSSADNLKPHVNKPVDITLDLATASNLSNYNSSVSVTLPAGTVCNGKISGEGSVSVKNNVLTWNAQLLNQKTASVTFQVYFTTIGTKTLNFVEDSSDSSSRLILQVQENTAEVNVMYDDVVKESEPFEAVVTISADEPLNGCEDVIVTFSDNFTIDFVESEYAVTNTGNVYTISPDLSEKNVNEITFTLTCNTTGNHEFTTLFETITKVYSVKVRPENLTLPYFARLILDEKVIDRLGDGKDYLVSSVMSLSCSEENSSLYDAYDYNYRIGVFNENPTGLETDEDYFSHSVWSEPISVINDFEEKSIAFKYCEDYPVMIFITGEYVEADASAINILYTYPCISEILSEDMSLEEPGLFPYPVKGLPFADDYCACLLNSFRTTNQVRAYDIDTSGLLTDDNSIIQGVSVNFDVNIDSTMSVLVRLITAEGKIGERSIIVNETTGSLEIGGQFDLWGLDFEDFNPETLENCELEIVFLNNYTHDSYIELNNLHITFHYIEITDSIIKAWVNGIDLRYYNVFINDVKIPAGHNLDVKYLEITGTDSNSAYRSNISQKELEIDFVVPGCDIVETSQFMERISRLFSNDRDKFNKPILNTIEFSHFPGRIWEFIMKDAIDADVEFSTYSGKIKLVIPSGDSRSTDAVITNATGVNSSMAKVNPEIILIANGTTITIVEENSSQKLIINDSTLSGDMIRIDCANRTVNKLVPQEDGSFVNEDITNKVDFNSDWFLIQGEYRFNCNNTANIQSISFYERW